MIKWEDSDEIAMKKCGLMCREEIVESDMVSNVKLRSDVYLPSTKALHVRTRKTNYNEINNDTF